VERSSTLGVLSPMNRIRRRLRRNRLGIGRWRVAFDDDDVDESVLLLGCDDSRSAVAVQSADMAGLGSGD